jgi:hypothetical protein
MYFRILQLLENVTFVRLGYKNKNLKGEQHWADQSLVYGEFGLT